MMEYKKYQIQINFKNRTNFLNCLNLLYKIGFRSYIDIAKFSYSMELKGTCLNKIKVDIILKLLKKCKIEYLELKTATIKTDKQIIIKDNEVLK